MSDTPELTADDIKNGWDAESLARYHAERNRVHMGIVGFDRDFRKQPRPTAANSKYSPLRWR